MDFNHLNNNNYIFGMLIIGIILLLILVIYLISRNYKNKRDYTRFRQSVYDEKTAEKEVAGRRRITPKMKQYILKRDNYTCQICGISKGFLDDLYDGLGDYLLLEIDHVNSVANGGTGSDEDNLQVLCWRCNRTKGRDRTNQEVKQLIDYGVEYLESDNDMV